jgi:hypothetical protein
VINCVIAGVVLAGLHKRLVAAPSAPAGGVRAEGGLRPSDASRSTSKV